MYKYLLILFCLILISCNDNFEQLPESSFQDTFLLKNIQTNKEIVYLRIDEIFGFTPIKKEEVGDYNLSLKISIPEDQNYGSIFPGCQPMYCAYRIAYIENNRWNFVTNYDELKSFIGEIDNEYEAFLIARINDYEIDNTSDGNGFIKTKFGYKLKVMKYDICPQTKQGFIIHVYKNGDFKEIKALDIYFKSHCIIY